MRDSRKARKKETEKQDGEDTGGGRGESRANTGGAGAGVDEPQERSENQDQDDCGKPARASAGGAGARRGGEPHKNGMNAGAGDEEDVRGEPMVGEVATQYRAMVARCNFLGCDRPDIQYAAKEASRWMSAPCHGDREKIVRIGKDLNGDFRMIVQAFPFGRDDGAVKVYSGLDWAGCLRIRKSTSGGMLCIGGCMIKHWSSTQEAIALSSAEAELYTATRALSATASAVVCSLRLQSCDSA